MTSSLGKEEEIEIDLMWKHLLLLVNFWTFSSRCVMQISGEKVIFESTFLMSNTYNCGITRVITPSGVPSKLVIWDPWYTSKHFIPFENVKDW